MDYLDIYYLFENNKEECFIKESHFSDKGKKGMAEIIYLNFFKK